MKICFIADANSIHTHRWINPFIERGYQIYLLSYKPVKRSWTGLKELIDLTQLTNINKARFAYWGWWIHRYVKRIKPDILHAHQITGAGWLGAMANYHPFVVSAWGSDILIEPHKSTFRRLLLKSVLNQCDQLTLPSQLMYNAAQDVGVPNNKLNLVPWGMETEIFKPISDDRLETRKQLGIRTDTKVILSTRGISSLYNIDILVNAIKKIVQKQANVQLALVEYNVDKTYLANLKEMIRNYKLESSIHWLPPQKTLADMARLYRMADIMVSIPSSEGYGFSVYEAMACGCPTIISDLPIFYDELVDGVHTIKVPIRDIVYTTKMLNTLLNNQSLCQSIRKNASNVCKNKGTQNQILITESLYRKLVSAF